MVGGIEGPFAIKREGWYFLFFSTWTRGYELGLMRSRTPLGPWELVDREPIFGTRKKGFRPELAREGGYDHLEYSDTPDPYCETGHNALFEGPDGQLWSGCHYLMDADRPHPYAQPLAEWEKVPQLGFEPVEYRDGRFFIKGPTWMAQKVVWTEP